MRIMAPQWFRNLELPRRLSDQLLSRFTAHRDGYMIWYEGSARFVCGKRTPPELVEDRWEQKKRRIDADRQQAVQDAARDVLARDSLTLIQLASLFYAFNDTRVTTGKPKRMSRETAFDYQRTINEMGAVIGPDKSVSELGPDDFTKYALSIADGAATSFARKVAYVQAFIRWAMQCGHFGRSKLLAALPLGVLDPLRALLGPMLVKPPQEDIRDERLEEEKSYEPFELRWLWDAAAATERIWIGLGLTGAFDNADVAHLPRPCVDFKGQSIDFRRRKRGKVRRFIPLHPGLLAAMIEYRRPDPVAADDDGERFFLTPTGLPLQRLGSGGHIDYVALRWNRLLVKSGLRAAPIVTKATDSPDGKKHIRMPEDHVPDGRGFRSLRTTFPNLAPPGFREEVEIIMGHAQGGVLLDHYLEKVGTARLKRLVTHVWHRAFACPALPGEECRCAWLSGPAASQAA